MCCRREIGLNRFTAAAPVAPACQLSRAGGAPKRRLRHDAATTPLVCTDQGHLSREALSIPSKAHPSAEGLLLVTEIVRNRAMLEWEGPRMCD
jgi:hypothetical protein